MCVCNVVTHFEFLRKLATAPVKKVKSIIINASESEIKILIEVIYNSFDFHVGPDKSRLLRKHKSLRKHFHNRKYISFSKVRGFLIKKRISLRIVVSVVISRFLKDELIELCTST
jgi:hypothetical protein